MVKTRDLHKNLEIKQDYESWNQWFIKRFNLKYGIHYYIIPKTIEEQKTLSATESVFDYYVRSFVKNLIIYRYLFKFPIYTIDIFKSIKSKKNYDHWINNYIDKFNWVECKHYIKLKKLCEDPRIGELRQVYMITKDAEASLLKEVHEED